MGLKSFLVVLDNPTETFYPGQNIAGRVILNIDSPKKLQSLDLTIKGEAEVRWSEHRRRSTRRGGSRSTRRRYRANELYFEHKHPLLTEGETTLPAGQYVYPFNVNLPANIPSSFEGTFGHIRYTAKAEIYRPWRFNHKTKTPFTVIDPLDLNKQESAVESVNEEAQKSFWTCCYKSLPLGMVMTVPVKGYVPGQEIPITLDVNNMSNVNISLITCNLVKVVTFIATFPHTKTRKMKYDVQTIIFPEVPPGGSETSTRTMRVPALPPTGIRHCSIIELAYKLKVTAKVGCCHTNLTLRAPVIIGSIPLQSFQSEIAPPKVPELPSPSAPYEQPLPSAPPFEAYPDLPPPSYEECMVGSSGMQDSEEEEEDDDKYTYGKRQFAPKYPMFNFNTK